jgi:hypothetical protein
VNEGETNDGTGERAISNNSPSSSNIENIKVFFFGLLNFILILIKN